MRLKFETLLKVQDYYGSSDFQIEARYDQLVNERGDSYYEEWTSSFPPIITTQGNE